MLIKYEMRKLFSGKLKWLLLLIFALNFVLYYLFLIPSSPIEEEQERYENLVKRTGDKEILAQELEAAEARIQEIEDQEMEKLQRGEMDFSLGEEVEAEKRVLSELQKEYGEALAFYDFRDEMSQRSQRLLQFSIFSKEGSFSKRNIEKTARDFQGLEEVQAEPLNGTGLEQMQQFPLTDLLLLVAVSLLSFQIFGKEGRSGMQKLLNTTVHGGRKLRLVQISAVTLVTFFFALAFYGSNVWQTGAFVGLPDFQAEIHGIMEYRSIPFPCTVGQYLLLFLLWKAAAACGVGMLFQAVIYRLSGAKIAWAILGGATAASFLCWFYLPVNPVMKIFRYLNLMGIFDVGEILGHYQNLNFFTYPVQLRTAAGMVLVLALLLGVGTTVLLSPSEIQFSIRRRRKRRGGCTGSVFFFECYKSLGKQKVWCIFVLLLCYVVYTGIPAASEIEYLTKEEYGYEQLAKQFIGQEGAELEESMERLASQQEFDSSEQAMAAQTVLS